MVEMDAKLIDVIDALASEYGWTIEYIQQLQLDESNALVEAITKRKKFEWRMQCYIVNCAMAGKQPSLDEKDTETGKEEMPEDIQLVKLGKELGIKLKKV